MNDKPVENAGSSDQRQETQYDRMDARAARQQRREERRASRGMGGAWVGGAILIAIGFILLSQNLGFYWLGNWWALFILIPAAGAFGNAIRDYNAAGGRLTAQARGSVIGGLVLTTITAVFLFNLSWGLVGPIILVLAGLGILINAVLPS